MIRLAAFDLDGTLLDHNMRYSARVVGALQRAQAAGVIVVLATGRAPDATRRFIDAFELRAPAICFQGGIVQDFGSGQVLFDTRLDPATLPFLVQLAAQRGWPLSFETPAVAYLANDSAHNAAAMRMINIGRWTRVRSLLTDLPTVPHKATFFVAEAPARAALIEALRAAVQAAALPLTITGSHALIAEALPAGLSKAVGLQWLAQHLGVAAAEVLAVGDNDNDVEMLRWAGVGVAMGNSSAAALAAADWVTAAVGQDGAALALERYL